MFAGDSVVYYCFENVQNKMVASTKQFAEGKAELTLSDGPQTLVLVPRVTALLRLKRMLTQPYLAHGILLQEGRFCACYGDGDVVIFASKVGADVIEIPVSVQLPLEECKMWLDALDDAFRSYLIAGFMVEKIQTGYHTR